MKNAFSLFAAAALLASTATPASAQFGGLGKALGKLNELKQKVANQAPVPAQAQAGAAQAGPAAPSGPAPTQAPGASLKVTAAGPFRTDTFKDLIGWNGKVYIAAGSDGGILELNPGASKTRLLTRKGWKTDNFYDNGVYELAAGPEGLFALRGKSLFKVDASGGTTFINEGWGYVKGMALLAGKLYVIDGETLQVTDLAPGAGSRQLADEWYNCQDLETVGGRLVALCQDRLWLVQPNGSRRQLGGRDYSDPKGIADVGGQIVLVSSTFHGHNVAANDKHEASIYKVDWNGAATRIAPLPKPWNIHELPHDATALNGKLYMPRAHSGGYSEDRELVIVSF